MVDALPQAIGDRTLGEQRRPAPADVLQHRRRSDDVQVGVLLAGERRRRQVLGGRAGADGIGACSPRPSRWLLISSAIPPGIGLASTTSRIRELIARRPLGSSGGEPGQLIQQSNELTVACYGLSIGVSGDAETSGTRIPPTRESSPEVGALASGRFEQGPVDLLKAQHGPGHPRSPVIHPAALRRTPGDSPRAPITLRPVRFVPSSSGHTGSVRELIPGVVQPIPG